MREIGRWEFKMMLLKQNNMAALLLLVRITLVFPSSTVS